jgi:hypothetical protein
MKIRSQILHVVLSVPLWMCFDAVSGAQQVGEQELPALSPALHAALYPEVMCAGCVVPHWDHGYLVHVEFDKDPAVVTMYDRVGKKVLESRMEPPGATKVTILSEAATQTGGIIAIGGGSMTDGSSQRFVVKSDATGQIMQTVGLGDFYPRQVCEAIDGTVWVLGFESNYGDTADADKNVLRHYSFEKGLLNSFVSLDSISKSFEASLNVSASRKSFLSCGKGRVTVLFWSAAQYLQIDTAGERLTRWKVSMTSEVPRRATGFAVTDEGRSFVSLSDFSEQDNISTTGLYELKSDSGTPVATLVSVAGTITKYDPSKIAPDGTFFYLWGTDGNELVVQRQGDGWGLSWARVSASATMTTKFAELQQ